MTFCALGKAYFIQNKFLELIHGWCGEPMEGHSGEKCTVDPIFFVRLIPTF